MTRLSMSELQYTATIAAVACLAVIVGACAGRPRPPVDRRHELTRECSAAVAESFRTGDAHSIAVLCGRGAP
jgi:hypothetical protein